ncbi:hypothetical protein WJX72_004572 [[Myrmecia] bisecta]|uniref:polyribonucleotide nucleotidyltransferase n=1 Tax=[Myrmecia] bisecta TaxID=41462 RepID=A0AAW1R614_9CHLO
MMQNLNKQAWRVFKLEVEVGGRLISIETGEIGRQANGAVLVTDGKTIIYTTACCSDEPQSDGSFVPLQVNYAERFSAAGRTSGAYFKRDGRPKEGEILASRLVDRPIRPMFAEGWSNDTQLLSWVLSYDGNHSPEPLAITAAGAALAVSDIPLKKMVAGVRVGLLPDQGFVINPTEQQRELSRLDMVIAGTAEAVLMVEGYCDFLTEEQVLEAVRAGSEAIATICTAVEEWARAVGKAKRHDVIHPPAHLDDSLEAYAGKQIENAFRIPGKQARGEAVAAIKERVLADFCTVVTDAKNSPLASSKTRSASIDTIDSAESVDDVLDGMAVSAAFKRVQSRIMRRLVVEEGYRVDGRGVREVRPIWSRAGLLPCVHGSALFTRGETQAVAVTTLGSSVAAQKDDRLTNDPDDDLRKFYLNYYFPPSSVGETGRVGGAGRREIGHGMLAERSLNPIIPDEADFPYTIRVESTITESNGSSSMASVCGGCLSLMDAGVPIKRPVAGVAMGLVLEPDGSFVVLTDILGSEDALGDMDFKVAGDQTAITAFQMDIKVEGITVEVMAAALAQASEGRRHILTQMAACSPAPRGALSEYAPRLRQLTVDPDKLGLLIGPGGRTIRGLVEESGVESIKVLDNLTGLVEVNAPSDASLEDALKRIQALLEEPEVGRTYTDCKVMGVEKFGIFVEILPNKQGLVHVSELDSTRVEDPSELFSVGDTLDVKLLDIDAQGRLKLSRRALMEGASGNGATPSAPLPEPVVGQVFREAVVKRVMPYGVFVEYQPTRQGLVHVSELDTAFVGDVASMYQEGDMLDVMMKGMNNGKILLSRKSVLLLDATAEEGPSTPRAVEPALPTLARPSSL